MHADRRAAQPIAAPNDAGGPGASPLLLVGTIVCAKAATIVTVLAISWTSETGGFVVLTHWHWLPMLAALVAAPLAFAVRLRRVRARRAALRRAEWVIADMDSLPATAGSVGSRVDGRQGAQ